MEYWITLAVFTITLQGWASGQTLVGPATTTKDDAPSSAVCPIGTLAVKCRCEHPDRCDGAFFTSFRTCTIMHRNHKLQTRPVVECKTFPCQGLIPLDIRAPSYDYQKKTDLSVTCPTTHTLTNCQIHSPWAQDLNHDQGVVIQGQTCRTNRKCRAKCSIQARCVPKCAESGQLFSLPEYDSNAERVYGLYTSEKDDSISTAVCPDGTIGGSCRCEHPDRCDGGYFTDAKTCKILHRSKKPATRAIATCQDDPCDDLKPLDLRSPHKQNEFSKDVILRVTCPTAFTLSSCILHSPWAHYLHPGQGVVASGNTCQLNKKCNKGCSIQARCIPNKS